MGELYNNTINKEKSFKDIIKEYIREFMLLIGLIAMSLVLSFASPYFLTFRNLMNILCQIAMIGICAIGMTYVIISDGIDLSSGAIAGLCGMLAVSFQSAAQGYNLPVVVAWIAALLIGTGLGAFNGLFIT